MHTTSSQRNQKWIVPHGWSWSTHASWDQPSASQPYLYMILFSVCTRSSSSQYFRLTSDQPRTVKSPSSHNHGIMHGLHGMVQANGRCNNFYVLYIYVATLTTHIQEKKLDRTRLATHAPGWFFLAESLRLLRAEGTVPLLKSFYHH